MAGLSILWERSPRRCDSRREWMADAAPKGARQDVVGADAGHDARRCDSRREWMADAAPKGLAKMQLAQTPATFIGARPCSRRTLGGFGLLDRRPASGDSPALLQAKTPASKEVGHAKLLSLPTIPRRAAARALFVPAAADPACPHLRRPQEGAPTIATLRAFGAKRVGDQFWSHHSRAGFDRARRSPAAPERRQPWLACGLGARSGSRPSPTSSRTD